MLGNASASVRALSWADAGLSGCDAGSVFGDFDINLIRGWVEYLFGMRQVGADSGSGHRCGWRRSLGQGCLSEVSFRNLSSTYIDWRQATTKFPHNFWQRRRVGFRSDGQYAVTCGVKSHNVPQPTR